MASKMATLLRCDGLVKDESGHRQCRRPAFEGIRCPQHRSKDYTKSFSVHQWSSELDKKDIARIYNILMELPDHERVLMMEPWRQGRDVKDELPIVKRLMAEHFPEFQMMEDGNHERNVLDAVQNAIPLALQHRARVKYGLEKSEG